MRLYPISQNRTHAHGSYRPFLIKEQRLRPALQQGYSMTKCILQGAHSFPFGPRISLGQRFKHESRLYTVHSSRSQFLHTTDAYSTPL